MKHVRLLAALGAWTLAASSAGVASAQELPPVAPSWTTVTFHFARPGLPIDRYTIQLQANGSGVYWEGLPDYSAAEVPNGQSQTIHAGAMVLAKVSGATKIVSAGKCETKLKKIANTGAKTLVYAGPSMDFRCTFNYSDDELLNSTAAALQAIAATMQAGARLAKLHRYDRLGLDAEIDSLVEQIKQGHAIEPANIAPVLQSIADDERVMERVRRKAARLLQGDATASR